MSINLSTLKTKENVKDAATHLPVKYQHYFPIRLRTKKDSLGPSFKSSKTLPILCFDVTSYPFVHCTAIS